jgi:prepilin-type N-terminal cleavage/methylation domain-containing protein
MTGRGSQPGRSRPVAGLCEPGALPYPRALRPRGFTLIELLITVSIIAIMASMILFALYGAGEAAKTAKTRALIVKLDAVIKGKWEAYKTRRVPLPPLIDESFTDTNGNGYYDTADTYSDANGNGQWDFSPRSRARMRLDALRDLMRMELPDRYTDLVDVTPAGVVTANPAPSYTSALNPFPIPTPSVWRSYMQRVRNAVNAGNVPTVANQGAECLYMIVMAAVADDADSRDVIKQDSIGDTDADGMPEFIDGWGQPIKFLRWAPGIQSELQVLVTGTVTASSGGPPATVTVMSSGLSSERGAYVGGTIAVIDQSQTRIPKPIQGNRMARITGYDGAGTFTCAVPSYTMQQPFGSAGPPTGNEPVVILAPDPFDSFGIYPIYRSGGNTPPSPDTSVPSFAIYPLIYSAGPDGTFGIIADVDDPSMGVQVLNYRTNGMNPFYINSSNNYQMLGTSADLPTEPKFTPGGWRDNIHNHLIGLK